MHTSHWDAIIIGGGAAGLSAALMLGRARRNVLVIDAGQPRNRFASHMHGVLGQEGVPPHELIARGRTEAASYGIEFITGTIARVEDLGAPGQPAHAGGVRVSTADGHMHVARALIVASGIRDELPEIPGLSERWGSTVLHCPYCHGWEVRDQRLGVLTTSPLGLHQAELIRQWSDSVTVFTAGLGDLSPETAARLRSRGITLESAPVAAVLGEGTAISAVQLEAYEGSASREVAVDAIFTAGTLRPNDSFLAELDLARSETPFGSFITANPMGQTSNARVWAVGNVVNPAAGVPVAIGAGSFTGAAVNAALVTWDFDAAEAQSAAHLEHVARPGDASVAAPGDVEQEPAAFWEERYAGTARVWSGKVNRVLADVAASLTPGRSLDIGCGEGGDVLWLAAHGWEATGIDISETAVARAKAAATAAELAPTAARFIAADLTTVPVGSYDLVTASFFQSPVALERESILAQAAALVTAGGHLLITSHAAPPSWADGHGQHRFLSPAQELAQLDLDPQRWEVCIAEVRSREVTAPNGDAATIDDTVILARRLQER